VAGSPHLDEVIVAPRRRWPAGLADEARLAARLRRYAFDLAIDFHGGPRASLLTWLSGARARIGYEVVGRSWMYTRRVPRPRTLRARHSVENQWDLLEPLGIGAADPVAFPVEMPVDPAAAAAVAARLDQAGAGPSSRLIVVHVSAGSPFRRWPAASFVRTVVAIAAGGSDRRVIVTAGPSDADAAATIGAEARRQLGTAADRVLQVGELTLAELRALLERAALYIGGDSGPLHVAATTRSPIVGLYGPTLPARSAPWRSPASPSEAIDGGPLPCRPCDQRVCAPGDFRCLTGIEPARVVAAAERLLDAARRS
jgi:ADP-heptose:LPS heptosyltransferase